MLADKKKWPLIFPLPESHRYTQKNMKAGTGIEVFSQPEL